MPKTARPGAVPSADREEIAALIDRGHVMIGAGELGREMRPILNWAQHALKSGDLATARRLALSVPGVGPGPGALAS